MTRTWNKGKWHKGKWNEEIVKSMGDCWKPWAAGKDLCQWQGPEIRGNGIRGNGIRRNDIRRLASQLVTAGTGSLRLWGRTCANGKDLR